jgi:hypothetical protein
MTLDKLDSLTLIDLKMVAKEVGVRGYQNFSSKAPLIEKIKAHAEQFGLEEVPDLVKQESETDPVVVSNRPIPMARKRIKDFPRKTVIVESRDPECVDYPFSVNEYSCYIQMGKPVSLPEPVIEFIKSITDIYFRKDPETGYSKHVEQNKFFVRYV